MKKTMTIISTILVLSMLAGAAFAWGPGRGRGGYGCSTGGSGYDCPGYTGQSTASDLSQEQKDQLTTLRQQYIDDTYEAKSAKTAKRQQIRLLMQTSNPDKSELVRLSNEIIDLDKQIVEQRINYQLEVKKISPELSGYGRTGFGRNGGMWSGSRGPRGFQQGNCPGRF